MGLMISFLARLEIQNTPLETTSSLTAMKKNSLLVTSGASVRVGDPIGQVGNSGNTTEPHLHIHASQGGTPDRLISGVGLPILFNEKFLVGNDIVAD